MKTLTPRRKAILAEIWRSNGHPPSCRELARVAGFAQDGTGSINHALTALRRSGYILWVDGKCRTLTLTDKGLLAAQGHELIYLCDQNGIHEVG